MTLCVFQVRLCLSALPGCSSRAALRGRTLPALSVCISGRSPPAPSGAQVVLPRCAEACPRPAERRLYSAASTTAGAAGQMSWRLGLSCFSSEAVTSSSWERGPRPPGRVLSLSLCASGSPVWMGIPVPLSSGLS